MPDTHIRDRLAEAVKAARAAHGLTQAKAARLAGISAGQLSGIEAGTYSYTFDTVVKLGDAVDLPMDVRREALLDALARAAGTTPQAILAETQSDFDAFKHAPAGTAAMHRAEDGTVTYLDEAEYAEARRDPARAGGIVVTAENPNVHDDWASSV